MIHSAGVIRDGRFRGGAAGKGASDVWHLKASSAWWLHKYTPGDGLGVFFVYSSMSAVLGYAG